MALDIMNYYENNYDAMVHLLKEMVSIESPSNDKKAVEKLLSFLEKKLQALGFFTMRAPGKKTGGFLYARPKKRNREQPIQLLVGHCDTVWKLHTIDDIPITENGKKLTGPGVYDMKAGLTQLLFSLSAIEDLSLKMNVTPVIIINSDEEIGSIESTNAIKRLSKIALRAYVLEPPLGLDGKLKTARKGIGRFTISVKGKAAHAGLDPEKGINAIVELSYQIQQLYAMNDFDRGITVNVGLIEGGNSPNVVAAESKAVIDVRVYTIKDGEQITEKIHALRPMLKDVELMIEGSIGRPPMEKTLRNKRLWKKAVSNGKLMGLCLEQATAGGGSDGNTTSLYTATLDGLGVTGDGAHAKHEFIYTDKIIERTTLLTLLLLEDEHNL